jgi:hypothetical protein
MFSRDNLKLLIICLGFFIVADLGIATKYDAVIYIAGIAIIFRRFTPYLLILVATMQDAPGFAPPSDYISFCFLFTILFSRFLLGYIDSSSRIPIFLKRVTLGALLVITYGLYNSIFFGYTQSSDRPYYLVWGLMSVMVISGVVAATEIARQRQGLKKLKIVAIVCILHILMVLSFQVKYGVDFLKSPIGAEAIHIENKEFLEANWGLIRLTGTFLSPNAASLAAALLCMLIIISYQNQGVGYFFIGLYSLMGLFICILTLNKSMVIFYAGSTLFLIWYRSKKLFVALGGLALIGFVYLATSKIAGKLWYVASLAFRWRGIAFLGERAIMWGAVINEFSWKEWILGTGLSHWPELFARYEKFPEKDPHSLLLSIPGTFGIVGIIYYLAIAYILFKFLRDKLVWKRMISMCLILIIFIRDLVEIPLFLHNSPMSYLIWLNLGLLFIGTIPAYGKLSSEQPSVTEPRFVLSHDKIGPDLSVTLYLTPAVA